MNEGKPRKLSDEERAVPAGAFPLPPAELHDELDNHTAAQQQPSAPAPEVAALDFIDGAPGKTVPLRFPFRWDGREFREVRVRPLSVTEVADLITRAAAGRTLDNMEFYAAMTGLPAAVLRALPGEDGEDVTEAAYRFLPRIMRDDALSPIPGDGGA